MAEEETKKTEGYNYLAFSLSLSLAIILIVGVFVMVPLLRQASLIGNQYAQKLEVFRAERQKLEDLKVLEENYNKLKEEASLAMTALPTEKEIPEFLVQLQNITKEAGGFLLSLTPSPQEETTASPFKEVNFKVRIYGTFTNLSRFTKNLEKNIRPIEITSIAIAKSSQNPKSNLLDITLNLKTFYQ